MYRTDKFVISRRPYAVDLSTFRFEVSTGWNGDHTSGTIDAVWFNRKSGVTRACVGELWDSQWGVPKDAVHFLERHEDGCYGGRCFARWDGTSFWCAGQDPEENDRYLALLKPMLDAYHANPKAPVLESRWDHWWRF